MKEALIAFIIALVVGSIINGIQSGDNAIPPGLDGSGTPAGQPVNGNSGAPGGQAGASPAGAPANNQGSG